MPKIRGIKPEYWTDEDIVELSIPARLLFIGLWNFACDNGHLADKPKQIKMRILPGDDVNIEKLLEELVSGNRIQRESGVITILKFAHHQKPHSRWWSTCDTPGCTKPDHSTTVVKGSRTGSHNGGPTVDHEEPRRTTAVVDGDGDGDGDGELMVNGAPRLRTGQAKRAHQLPDDFRPNDKHLALAAELQIDLRSEWPQFVDHHRAKGNTMKDWNSALNTWIRNAAKFSRGRQAPALALVTNPSQLPPVEESWMSRRPR